MLRDTVIKALSENPDGTAYISGEEVLTNGELLSGAMSLCSYLLKNYDASLPVIIYGHKEAYMKIAVTACIFAGITYVPIDRKMPKLRVDAVIEQTEPSVIIGDFLNGKANTLPPEALSKIIASNDKPDKLPDEDEDRIFYIIFTSGTTGEPKGVSVTYGNINSCVNWLNELYDGGTVLNQADFSFDLSVADFYLSLTHGSCHFIPKLDKLTDFGAIFESLKKSGAAFAVMTPSFARLLLADSAFNENLLPQLRTILFCGERLPCATVNKLYDRFPRLKIINAYGPSEATFAVTSCEVPRGLSDRTDIPIGTVKPDCEIYIVDDGLNELPEGESGEMLIVGSSVAAGYYKRNISDKFITYRGRHAYRTGDRGHRVGDVFYFDKREDSQIKFHGYRIELSDIKENIEAVDGVEQAVVITVKNSSDIVTGITAYVRTELTSVEVRSALEALIPSYMIPKIKTLSAFPINDRGKLDMRGLEDAWKRESNK